MKFTRITLSVALLGALTVGMADTANVDAQIEAIKAAPAEKRVEMMNEFKQKLATMNQEERMSAIAQMQEKMQGKMESGKEFGSMTHEHVQNAKEHAAEMGEQTRTRVKEMAQEHQMQANEQMKQMQNMNQFQAGNQFNQMNIQGNIPGGVQGGNIPGGVQGGNIPGGVQGGNIPGGAFQGGGSNFMKR